MVDNSAQQYASPEEQQRVFNAISQPKRPAEQTPEQRALEAVRHHLRREALTLSAAEAASLDAGETTIHQIKVRHRLESYAALDRLCTERYAAGKVAGLKAYGQSHACREKRPETWCEACRLWVEAEAEYEAAVAALEADTR